MARVTFDAWSFWGVLLACNLQESPLGAFAQKHPIRLRLYIQVDTRGLYKHRSVT